MDRTRRTGVRVDRDAPHDIFGTYKTDADFLTAFRAEMTAEATTCTPEQLQIELKGLDSSLSNALRRILLAEVPTMAIESVYISENSSIIQDEVLAHRLGLVPILADPTLFTYKEEADPMLTTNTIVFQLDASCRRTGTGSAAQIENAQVYSSALVLDTSYAQGTEGSSAAAPIKPVHQDILLAKLKPGQSIKLTAYCHKGIGRDHAKFSPVATASYRLMPRITVDPSVTGELARELVEKCPSRVFDIEDLTGGVEVARPKQCTMCRECIRDPEWGERVRLERDATHFLFSVESVGMLPASDLLLQSIAVLKGKCGAILEAIDEQQAGPADSDSGEEDDDDDDEEDSGAEEPAAVPMEA